MSMVACLRSLAGRLPVIHPSSHKVSVIAVSLTGAPASSRSRNAFYFTSTSAWVAP
jgi:hypothetical protein